jgi:hypothetical protein
MELFCRPQPCQYQHHYQQYHHQHYQQQTVYLTARTDSSWTHSYGSEMYRGQREHCFVFSTVTASHVTVSHSQVTVSHIHGQSNHSHGQSCYGQSLSAIVMANQSQLRPIKSRQSQSRPVVLRSVIVMASHVPVSHCHSHGQSHHS